MIRFFIFGPIALVLIYIIIMVYSRSIRREKLEDWWDKAPVEGMDRDTYIADGMAKYESGLRKKLILLVFVIPPIVVGTIIYFIN